MYLHVCGGDDEDRGEDDDEDINGEDDEDEGDDGDTDTTMDNGRCNLGFTASTS